MDNGEVGMMPMTFMNLTIETSYNRMRWQVMNGQLSHFFFGKYAGSQKGLPFQVKIPFQVKFLLFQVNFLPATSPE